MSKVSQTAVSIHVLQGERAMASDNKTLGRFDLVGIPPAPRGIPQVEVTFDIDANGILHVSAKDLGTGKEQAIKITAANKLKDDDIQRMRKEAEEHAKEDEGRRKEVETLNTADATVYSTEKLLDEMKDKFGADKLESIRTELGKLKELLAAKEKDVAEISQRMDELNKKVQEASTELYQKAAQQHAEHQKEGPADSAKKDENDEDVVEADFKEER